MYYLIKISDEEKKVFNELIDLASKSESKNGNGNLIVRKNISTVIQIKELETTHTKTIDNLIERISKQVGFGLYYFIDNEIMTLSVIKYLKGDFISKHYDFNWSTGEKYTIIFEINKSDSNFSYIDDDKTQKEIIPLANQVILFPTGKYLHYIPTIKKGERISVCLEVFTNKTLAPFYKRWLKKLYDRFIF